MIPIVIILVTFFAKLIYDLYLYNRKPIVSPNHAKEWLICSVPYGYAAWLLAAYLSLNICVALLISAWAIAFNVLLFFNGLYNLKRGFNWWFLGTDDGKADAWTDRQLRWFEKRGLLKLFLIVMAGGSLLLYLFMLFKSFS